MTRKEGSPRRQRFHSSRGNGFLLVAQTGVLHIPSRRSLRNYSKFLFEGMGMILQNLKESSDKVPLRNPGCPRSVTRLESHIRKSGVKSGKEN